MILTDLIKTKYTMSESMFKHKFTNEAPAIFLSYFDIMNMYALFPTPLDCKIDTNNRTIKDLITEINKSYVSDEHFDKQNKEYLKLLSDKLNFIFKENDNTNSDMLADKGKIRYFFSYEVIDYVVANYSPEYVTTAWLKCYEALNLFDLIPASENTVNYFGICEQPGAFVFAINHYIKTHGENREFNFILQSLKAIDKKIFKPEDALAKEYRDNYDYGPKDTGDVTDLENIKYYRKRNYKRHFHIISADCGLDCSDDFAAQEKTLLKVILGQALLAISLADKGTNYFFKLFSMYESLTCEIIYLMSYLFEEVYVVRLLKTKITSGEVYCICKNFKYDKSDVDGLLDILYDKYSHYNDNDYHLLNLPEEFKAKILDYNKVLLYCRLTSYNFSYFRYNNLEYVNDNQEIKKYIDNLVNHYAKYFSEFYNIRPLAIADKLVTKDYKSKWLNK